MSPILKLDPHDGAEEQELAFELAYQQTLTVAQRFEMMLRCSRELASELLRRGHRRPVEVVKRS